MNYCIDWLSFTLPVERGHAFLGLHFFDVQHLEYGGRGYTRSAIVYGTGRVYWHPDRPEMGVHFDLPSGCLAAWFADWESHNPGRQLGPKGVIFRVLTAEGHFTRIDVAWDDTEGQLDLAVIIAAVEAGEAVSRWRSFHVFRKGTLVNGSPTGLGLSCGSRVSDAYLRIYCQEPDVNVPPMFTQSTPGKFTQNVPPMFTQNTPLVFTRNVPPFPEPALGAAQAGSEERVCKMRLLCPGEGPGNSIRLLLLLCFSLTLLQ